MNPETEKCAECRYFVLNEKDKVNGTCHRHAPALQTDLKAIVWPAITTTTASCGDGLPATSKKG
jgi:hypothetical protein